MAAIMMHNPQVMQYPLPQYNHHMSHSGFFGGMPVVSKPMAQEHKTKNGSPGQKRRPSRAGTRSVSTLTAAQLERKRANDREAQRAIRQRTKDHIESLERRIQELTSAGDSQAKLAQALQRAEELEQENKVLRNRLNQAVTAMAEGAPISPEMLTGPSSPSRRLRVATRCSSVPTAPRSIPNASLTPSLTPQDSWSPAFSSPVASTADRSPSIADVSPVSGSMRWGGHNHQHSPALTDPGQSMDNHHGCPQPSVGYNYMLDNSNRGVSYSPEPGMLQPYSSSVGHDSIHAYSHQQQLPSPAYSQYSATQQSYISTSPHQENEQSLHMVGQQSPVEMYAIPPSAKEE